jgi:ribulose 1,5-bisphosphate carboxylase large subunit-like protein
MKKYNLSDIFIYHNYLVVVFTDGAWEIICPTYYCIATGEAPDQASAVAATKARIDTWVDRVRKQQQEREQK